MDVNTRAMIAGKFQSAQQSVDEPTVSERVQLLADEIATRAQSGATPNFRESVSSMYIKGGFVASRDSLVCLVSWILLNRNMSHPWKFCLRRLRGS